MKLTRWMPALALLGGLLCGAGAAAQGLPASPAANPAPTLKVLTAGAFKEVVLALVPAFEADTRIKVEVRNDTNGALVRRIAGGEAFDVAFLTPAGFTALAKDGRIAAASVTPLARTGIGVAVRKGEPKPPIGTVEQFKAAVLAARKVAYIDPAAGGTSGIYLDGLFQRLGIAEAVRAKAVLVPGGLVAERLVSGEADLALHQVSEILPVAGAELVGTLPEEIQSYTVYSGGLAVDSRMGEAAQMFLAAFTASGAAATIRAKGMTPAR